MQGRTKSRFQVPEALAMEVLLKLPVKSLARFNCVSRRPPFPGYTGFKCVGFGYDSETDDYKIIQFVTLVYIDEESDSSPVYRSQVELYSLKTDSWKEVASVPNACPFSNYLGNNCVDGVCSWEAMMEYHRDNLILSFDMVSEKFSTSPLPELDGALTNYKLELLELNGSLGVVVYPRFGTEKSFDLWAMDGGWTKQLSVESIPGVEEPMGFWKNGEMFIGGSDHELLLFEPYTREVKKLGVKAYPDAMCHCLIAYVESLVPINGKSEHAEHIIRRPSLDT
ncbi:Detected protein of unknown function [Hibiscus syriacus]|uniref:F-box associated beta-propeller type 3 domain-containing protein n=1 Tax=Hibiscus syriacus TaxID=106335 RepID=A0A6A3CIN7_HIBSY|nr:Detected protein of unknown function [Hibiscus syriacus]